MHYTVPWAIEGSKSSNLHVNCHIHTSACPQKQIQGFFSGWMRSWQIGGSKVFLILFPHVLATSGLKTNNKMFVCWFYVISMTTFPVNVIAIVRNYRIGLRVDTGSQVHQFVTVLPTSTASDRKGQLMSSLLEESALQFPPCLSRGFCKSYKAFNEFPSACTFNFHPFFLIFSDFSSNVLGIILVQKL